MVDDQNETADTRGDARQVLNQILTFHFLALLGFWNKILVRIDRAQKRLQDHTINFHDAAYDLKALQDYFLSSRESLASESLEAGLKLCDEWDIQVERRPRKKKQMPGEKAKDVGLTAKEEMMRIMKETIDRLHNEMEERFVRLHDLDSKFGFLLDARGLLFDSNESNSSHDVNILKKSCLNLGQFYSNDIDGFELYEEILDCKMLLKSRPNVQISKAEELLKFIVQYGDENVFPNLRVAIQIMLTIAISITNCERSFSKLTLILSYLRASMGQERLSALALLSIEREETEITNFDDIIDKFASAKVRKIHV